MPRPGCGFGNPWALAEMPKKTAFGRSMGGGSRCSVSLQPSWSPPLPAAFPVAVSFFCAEFSIGKVVVHLSPSTEGGFSLTLVLGPG